MSPEATVHAEIERRLELAGTHRRYAPVRQHRSRPWLSRMFRRLLHTPRPVAPVTVETAGRHHLPVPMTGVH